jgi:NAD(P)-dependent dehydrogenase (short-subunit alcohol dehydrogenase family)
MPHISQFSAFFPPSPKFTDKNLPSLKGKVYIVTGGASGVGYELAKILYVAGGTVYIAARSIPRCEGAIEKIKSETGTSKEKNGQLKSMVVDLADMTTLKPAAEKFMREESRLDVLVHNAAVMTPPAGSKDTHVSKPRCVFFLIKLTKSVPRVMILRLERIVLAHIS